MINEQAEMIHVTDMQSSVYLRFHILKDIKVKTDPKPFILFCIHHFEQWRYATLNKF